MSEETIIGHIKVVISLQKEFTKWFKQQKDIDTSKVNVRRSNLYINEELLGNTFNSTFLLFVNDALKDFFSYVLGINRVDFPNVKMVKSYKGSWVIKADIFMLGDKKATVKTLKKVVTIDKLNDLSTTLTTSLTTKYQQELNSLVYNKLMDLGIVSLPNDNIFKVTAKVKGNILKSVRRKRWFFALLFLASLLGLGVLALYFYPRFVAPPANQNTATNTITPTMLNDSSLLTRFTSLEQQFDSLKTNQDSLYQLLETYQSNLQQYDSLLLKSDDIIKKLTEENNTIRDIKAEQ